MKALSLTPAIAFSAKGAATTEGLTDTQHILSTLGSKLKEPDLGISVVALSAAQVLFDAITRAGSENPAKIDTALAATDKTYPIGLIKFGANHACQTNLYVAQWQNGTVVQLVPAASAATSATGR